MDTGDEEIVTKRCFKCDQAAIHNLNIAYNESNSMVILWNKFQIFVYENFYFECESKTIVSEFQIDGIIISNNYLICLDNNGNVHVTSLKFKNSTQKRFKSCFQLRDKNIKQCIKYDDDHALSMKHENNTYSLCLHKINTEFQLVKRTYFETNDNWPLEQLKNQKFIIYSNLLKEEYFDELKAVFKVKENGTYTIILICFDKLNIYGCLYSPKIVGDIRLVKLYSSPTEICSIEFMNMSLLIGLTSGTILNLFLNDMSKAPEVTHLNTALYKTLFVNNSLIYTDGICMWKAEKLFGDYTKFYQFFIKHVYDFSKCGDHIICSTFTKLIYILPMDYEQSYLTPQNLEEYCSAEKLLNNSEYLYTIFEEIERNNDLVKKLNEQSNYITALSLANRQDIMDNIIKTKIIVYENYEDAVHENQEITLTEDTCRYFNKESFLLSIKITASPIQHVFNRTLSNLLGDLKIHFTFFIDTKVLKTTSIKLQEQLKKVNYLIPIRGDHINSYLNVFVEIVTNVPGALDGKHTIWTVLYRKTIKLNLEHFIKTNEGGNSIVSLKIPKESLESMILDTSQIHYGGLFNFTNVKVQLNVTEWSFYLKLPDNYEELFKKDNYCVEIFNKKRINYLLKQYSADEFLKSRMYFTITVGYDKVKVEIVNDGFTCPSLKVCSGNVKTAFYIRNFFSNIIYYNNNGFVNYEPGKEFISNTFYTITENLQKAVKQCIANSVPIEDFLLIVEQFEKCVIGGLPL